MTKAELHKWLQLAWKERDEPRLLVLDQYRPHRTADTKSLAESLDTDIAFVPGGCTGIAQPLDVNINALLREYGHNYHAAALECANSC